MAPCRAVAQHLQIATHVPKDLPIQTLPNVSRRYFLMSSTTYPNISAKEVVMPPRSEFQCQQLLVLSESSTLFGISIPFSPNQEASMIQTLLPNVFQEVLIVSAEYSPRLVRIHPGTRLAYRLPLHGSIKIELSDLVSISAPIQLIMPIICH